MKQQKTPLSLLLFNISMGPEHIMTTLFVRSKHPSAMEVLWLFRKKEVMGLSPIEETN